jgi:hypothetical protein
MAETKHDCVVHEQSAIVVKPWMGGFIVETKYAETGMGCCEVDVHISHHTGIAQVAAKLLFICYAQVLVHKVKCQVSSPQKLFSAKAAASPKIIIHLVVAFLFLPLLRKKSTESFQQTCLQFML